MSVLGKLFKQQTEQNPQQSGNANKSAPIPVSQGRGSTSTVELSPAKPLIKKTDKRIFGRFSDAHKNKLQLAAWDAAQQAFKNGELDKALHEFFVYLNDPQSNNVEWKQENKAIVFLIHQGSKSIEGRYENGIVHAKAILAEFDIPPIPVMRMLLGANYSLKYTSFGMEGNSFILKLYTDFQHTGITHLYHALKELATKADRQDDLLTEEFPSLRKMEAKGLQRLSEEEQNRQYSFFKLWIEQDLEKARALNADTQSGAISYILLNTLYKIDYLLMPQGSVLEKVEQLVSRYWDKNDQKSFNEKNEIMMSGLDSLLERKEAEVKACFYRTQATFGMSTPAAHSTIANFIDECLKNTAYYIQHKMFDIEKVIYSYCIHYCMYSFGMTSAHYRLMDLLNEILESDYYKACGIDHAYVQEGIIQKAKIEQAISEVLVDERADYPQLTFMTQNLKYQSEYEFYFSYLNEIRYLNFNK